ncbi:MAG: hypothetical protein GWP16_01635 [Nitrospirae bacterium]|nr:hypothetical protein [Nitrospirota bacterium]
MTDKTIDYPFGSQRRHVRLVVMSALAMAALLIVGCKQSPTAEQVRLELEHQLPGAKFERESHIHLGRVSMSAVKQVLRFTSPKGSTERKLIASLKRVDVATYRVVSPPEDPVPSGVAVLERRLEHAGWTVAVKERDFDERTWVLYREDDKGSIRSLCVVSLDAYELEVVSVDGRIDELLAEAIADDPGGFVQSLGS